MPEFYTTRRGMLEPHLVDGEAQPVASHQLVVGEPTLQVLSDHVDVLEVALEQILVVDRGHAGRVVDGVDHLGREPDAVRRGETERRAVVQGYGAGRRRGPDLMVRFVEGDQAG